MSNKKSQDKNTRKLTRLGGKHALRSRGEGGSLGLTLPVEIVRKLRWKERQKVRVFLQGRSVIIRDWKS